MSQSWSGRARKTLRARADEVKEFFQRSLERTRDGTAAWLNTQCKILATLWGMWKRKESYRKELFVGSASREPLRLSAALRPERLVERASGGRIWVAGEVSETGVWLAARPGSMNA